MAVSKRSLRKFSDKFRELYNLMTHYLWLEIQFASLKETGFFPTTYSVFGKFSCDMRASRYILQDPVI